MPAAAASVNNKHRVIIMILGGVIFTAIYFQRQFIGLSEAIQPTCLVLITGQEQSVLYGS